MQRVSKAYKESMQSSLRERAYIMLSFGMINQEAQAKATVEHGEYASYSNVEGLFSQRTDDTVYASLEENFTPVDGSTFFLPKSPSASYYNTGLVSEELVSSKPFSVTIALNTLPTDFKGLTVNFGANYPVDFDIESDSGQTVSIRDNDQSEFTTEEVFEAATSITLTVLRMTNPQSRVRIYSIRFGYGLVYYNDSVMNSTLETYVSPIGADIPQIDFSVTLKNYDKYFNVDNPDSAVHFLETGQEMDIYYGYQLPEGSIEWVKGNHLICSDWESDDKTATIRCQDIFRSMDTEYYQGRHDSAGTSYYDLATEVLSVAGVSDYYLDPHLKTLYTRNPLPRVKCKEALQIIANACRCVLTQSRSGAIHIKSNFTPTTTISSNGETSYSDVENVLNGEFKVEYATLATNYTVVDGGMFFMPRNGDLSQTGYVSQAVSDANGTFGEKPVLTIVKDAASMCYGVKMVFGQSLPSGFRISTYNAGTPVDTVTVTDGIELSTVVHYDFGDFDRMEIEFVGTATPYNRITLNHFSFGDVTDFTMTKRDMTSSPKAIKQELTREVIVPCYSYHKGIEEESLVSEEITVKDGESVTYLTDVATYDYRATLDESSEGVSVTAWGDYYVTLTFATAGTYRLEVFGYHYKIVERNVRLKMRDRGRTIRWENPLISDMDQANDLAQWIADYYSASVEYEYNTRGNPELDANDIIYQVNDFGNESKVVVYRTTLKFAQTFSGNVTTRRLEG